MKKLIYVAAALLLFGCSTDSPSPNPEPKPVEVKKPVAVDDAVNGTEDEDLVISGLLDNDTVENNARITSFDTETSQGGSVKDNRNGTYTYTPPADFVGEDTFDYTLCDQEDPQNCSSATVTITVNDAGSPQANDDEVFTVTGVALTSNKLIDNDDLTDDAHITSTNDSSSKGTVTLNEDGSITYTPQASYKGQDTFTYTICDDDQPEATCSTATVTVNVLETVAFNIPAELQDYYSDLAITTSQELNYEFVSDHTIRHHTTILTYFQRHDYLYEADEDLDNPDNVILMYSGESRYWKEYTSDSNPYSPQTFNTEHIYPQSLLNAADAVTDLHHLRSADASINSLRLNYPFTEGSGEYGIVDGDKWYPGDEWKGDVARMVMYLNVRYGEKFEKVGTLALFLKWNREDPVSPFEIHRNEVIQGAQGNRNPFIDNPYLATLIWGGEAAENRWQ